VSAFRIFSVIVLCSFLIGKTYQYLIHYQVTVISKEEAWLIIILRRLYLANSELWNRIFRFRFRKFPKNFFNYYCRIFLKCEPPFLNNSRSFIAIELGFFVIRKNKLEVIHLYKIHKVWMSFPWFFYNEHVFRYRFSWVFTAT
jgi:hypothetical protein